MSGRPDDLAHGETWCVCGAIWRGASRICHCMECHRTFTGLAGFDRHFTVEDGELVCADDRAQLTADPDGRYRAPSSNPPPGVVRAAD